MSEYLGKDNFKISGNCWRLMTQLDRYSQLVRLELACPFKNSLNPNHIAKSWPYYYYYY